MILLGRHVHASSESANNKVVEMLHLPSSERKGRQLNKWGKGPVKWQAVKTTGNAGC